MIELPEARTIARDLRETIVGKTIVSVGGNFTDHKFTFYGGDPDEFDGLLSGKQVTGAIGRSFYIEVEIEDQILLFRDGAAIRYFAAGQKRPDKSKLLLEFDDGSFLNVTTLMYCFIGVMARDAVIDNMYYALDVNGIGACDARFTLEYFQSLINDATLKLSTKAFIATEQRIPGIGNGVTQDILFNAGLHPKRKMSTLSADQVEGFYDAVVSTIQQMIELGGRDTERTIFGTPGGYQTILSSKTYRKQGCPNCRSEIVKQQYLGGSVYFCPNCQPLSE
ncbi:MAG: formamidopyrimidine-DNA glycosylase [Coriobacteriia bacterium]|nr:formamidopyrimidine-DNA glycosylase [Coriobacteriia bacterium]